MAVTNTYARKQINHSRDTKVIVSFPDSVEIPFVQANDVKHYEMFQWLALLVAPIASGFWTAYFTLPEGVSVAGLLWGSIVFTAIAGLFIIMAINFRRKIYHGSVKKEVSLQQFN